MNHLLNGVVRAVSEAFVLPEPIVEIGSFQVVGQEEIADLRGLFPGKKFIGVDKRPGPGVDRVADVEDLPFANKSCWTVLALSTFEHVRRFWRGFEELQRILRPDGALVVAVPFYFQIHNYPSDYWRFSPEALNVLLEKYPRRILGWHGPKKKPANVWAVAFGEEHPGFDQEAFDRYRQLLSRYAREPLPWGRRLRYRLGSWLFGKGHFAPILEMERWETHVARTHDDQEQPGHAVGIQSLLAPPGPRAAAG